jgi:hypothetical protein
VVAAFLNGSESSEALGLAFKAGARKAKEIRGKTKEVRTVTHDVPFHKTMQS